MNWPKCRQEHGHSVHMHIVILAQGKESGGSRFLLVLVAKDMHMYASSWRGMTSDSEMVYYTVM